MEHACGATPGVGQGGVWGRLGESQPEVAYVREQVLSVRTHRYHEHGHYRCGTHQSHQAQQGEVVGLGGVVDPVGAVEARNGQPNLVQRKHCGRGEGRQAGAVGWAGRRPASKQAAAWSARGTFLPRPP